MNSTSYHPPDEEEVCSNKQGLWLNIVVKEEEEEEVTVKAEEGAIQVKEEKDEGEEKAVVKTGETNLTLKEEGDQKVVIILSDTREAPDPQSQCGKSPSGEPDPETSRLAGQHQCFQCGKQFINLSHLKDHEKLHTVDKPHQ
ncbi:hypothetical protein DPEC_G00168760, partial [Dallia pectoralis]